MCEIVCWKKAHVINKNIDGFYTKTTQQEDSASFVKKNKKRCYTDLLHFSTRKHNLVSFYGWIVFWQNCIVVFYIRILFFFQEKTLGDISFKLATKIVNFMSVFFRKKYNQANSSVVNNMQYNLFSIFPLSGAFAEFGFVFIDFITYFRF
jgi:hypothetical protein